MLERQPLDEMCRILGQERAEYLVGCAMEELALWLCQLPRLSGRGELAEVARLGQRINGMAARLGMPLLARVAEDLHRLAEASDPAALGAVLCRIARVGEQSLVAVWDLQDLSV